MPAAEMQEKNFEASDREALSKHFFGYGQNGVQVRVSTENGVGKAKEDEEEEEL